MLCESMQLNVVVAGPGAWIFNIRSPFNSLLSLPLIRYETDLSYDVNGGGEGDRFVGISIQEARMTVDRQDAHEILRNSKT